MALSKAQLIALVNNLYPNNISELISAEDLREGLTEIINSTFNQISDADFGGLTVWRTGKVYAPNQCIVIGDDIYKALVTTNPNTFNIAEWQIISDVASDLADYALKDNVIELDSSKLVKHADVDTNFTNLPTGIYFVEQSTVTWGLQYIYPTPGKGLVYILKSSNISETTFIYYTINDFSKFHVKRNVDSEWSVFNQNINLTFGNGLTQTGNNVGINGEFNEIYLEGGNFDLYTISAQIISDNIILNGNLETVGSFNFDNIIDSNNEGLYLNGENIFLNLLIEETPTNKQILHIDPLSKKIGFSSITPSNSNSLIENGLTKTDLNVIKLGGVLTENTVIDGTNFNLIISGTNGLKYSDIIDYTDRTLVDKQYVDGKYLPLDGGVMTGNISFEPELGLNSTSSIFGRVVNSDIIFGNVDDTFGLGSINITAKSDDYESIIRQRDNAFYQVVQNSSNLNNCFINIEDTNTALNCNDNVNGSNGLIRISQDGITLKSMTSVSNPSIILKTTNIDTSDKTLEFQNKSGTIALLSDISVSIVSGTPNRITVTSGTNAIVDISPVFEGLVAKRAEKLNQFAITSSSELIGVISDETGTGLLVFNTSPTFVTSLLTSSTTFSLFNTVATTINAFSEAEVLNIGNNTIAQTINLGTGAVSSGNKVVNIGTGGIASTITTVNIGSPTANSSVNINRFLNITNAGEVGLKLTNTNTGQFWLLGIGGGGLTSNNLFYLSYNLSGGLTLGSGGDMNLNFTNPGIFTSATNGLKIGSANTIKLGLGTGGAGSVNQTSGNRRIVNIFDDTNNFFNPTSGTLSLAWLGFVGTVNQTGTANGFSRLIDFSSVIYTSNKGTHSQIYSTLSYFGGGGTVYFIDHNTGDAQSRLNGSLSLTGDARIITYRGLPTVAMGVAPILADFNVTNRTTEYPALPTPQLIYTPAVTGLYELTITVEYLPANNLLLTAFIIYYTNGANVTQHIVEPNYFTTQFSKTYVASIRCNANSNISFSTALSEATTHNIDIIVKRLR